MPARAVHRRAFRRAVRLPCQIVRERDFKLVADLALDLSTEGMRATLRTPVLTGEQVIVAFRSMRLGRWFDAEATVARVVHGRRDHDFGRSVGLVFDGVDGLFRDDLFEHLRQLPPPVRRARVEPSREEAALLAMPPLFSSAGGRLTVA
ncbi:MAG TPA: PilZ domain-containing protein [Byssovorax sp.]